MLGEFVVFPHFKYNVQLVALDLVSSVKGCSSRQISFWCGDHINEFVESVSVHPRHTFF